ncbi:MAG: malto-oligosyltrehalose trehalohydrolase [Bryobacterales bacterium]|nr:malto-oligosyltrehalose trehalohydrolase [Bryobacterales bacterium]
MRTRYGAQPNPAGGFDFRVWAPRQRSLRVRVQHQEYTFRQESEGDFFLNVPDAVTGQDYFLVTDTGADRPDPAARYQPKGVHGPSRLCDGSAFNWTDSSWKGLPLKDYVFYELHTGAFTDRGTFDAIVERLDHLADLGITAIELMPIAEFPGRRNWGYDGVSLYAPHSAYGGPDGLRKLVDACHARNFAVVLDVVYNHLGPEGNYLGEFAPYFTAKYQTPWGDALDYSRPEVRRFFVDNALYWLSEFHIDALRLDAVHGIFDDSPKHILQQLSEEFTAAAQVLGRQAWLIAESESGDVRDLGIDAIWHDEFHHALIPILTGNRRGYLRKYGDTKQVAQAATEGFVIWESSGPFHPTELVSFIQNHDQVANPCLGDRQGSMLTFRQQQVAAAVLCFSPWLPLIFMGQEYGETNPFLYFVSHTDAALVEAVRTGRRAEFASFYETREFPDPQDAHTFSRCRLDWTKLNQRPYLELFSTYRDLLALRKRLTWPAKGQVKARYAETSGWLVLTRPDAILVANLSDSPVDVDLGAARGELLWSTTPAPVIANSNLSIEPWSAAIYTSS